MYILGSNVTRLRVEQGLTKTTFALMSDISRPTLIKIEKGACDVRLSYLQRIADAFCADPVRLLIESGELDELDMLNLLEQPRFMYR